MVYFHKVDVKHHASQGNEYGTGQDRRVLQENRGHVYNVLQWWCSHTKGQVQILLIKRLFNYSCIVIASVFRKGLLSYLCEEEHGVCYKPHAAGVHNHLADGHLRGAYGELPANAGVPLTVQGYGFAVDVTERLIFHCEPE